MMTLGDRLRQLREREGLSQTELAKRADLTAAAVWQIENDKRTPSATTLLKLADALNVSADLLMGRASDDELLTGNARILLRGFQELSDVEKDTVQDIVDRLRRKPGGQS